MGRTVGLFVEFGPIPGVHPEFLVGWCESILGSIVIVIVVVVVVGEVGDPDCNGTEGTANGDTGNDDAIEGKKVLALDGKHNAAYLWGNRNGNVHKCVCLCVREREGKKMS